MIEKAKLSEVPWIKKLIDNHAEKDEMMHRSMSEIYESIRSFFVWREKLLAVGCCALYVVWKDLAEIKSLAVDEKHMAKGIGKELVEACLKEAKELEIPRVFTLTTKPEFFTKLGFTEISRDELPMKVWGECIRCPKYECCDETALVIKVK